MADIDPFRRFKRGVYATGFVKGLYDAIYNLLEIRKKQDIDDVNNKMIKLFKKLNISFKFDKINNATKKDIPRIIKFYEQLVKKIKPDVNKTELNNTLKEIEKQSQLLIQSIATERLLTMEPNLKKRELSFTDSVLEIIKEGGDAFLNKNPQQEIHKNIISKIFKFDKVPEYCGPGTPIIKNLLLGVKPDNNVDKACMEHDIAYLKIASIGGSNDEVIKETRKADLKLLKDVAKVKPKNDNERQYKTWVNFFINQKINLEDRGLLNPLSFITRTELTQEDIKKVDDVLGEIKEKIPINLKESKIIDGNEFDKINNLSNNITMSEEVKIPLDVQQKFLQSKSKEITSLPEDKRNKLAKVYADVIKMANFVKGIKTKKLRMIKISKELRDGNVPPIEPDELKELFEVVPLSILRKIDYKNFANVLNVLNIDSVSQTKKLLPNLSKFKKQLGRGDNTKPLSKVLGKIIKHVKDEKQTDFRIKSSANIAPLKQDILNKIGDITKRATINFDISRLNTEVGKKNIQNIFSIIKDEDLMTLYPDLVDDMQRFTEFTVMNDKEVMNKITKALDTVAPVPEEVAPPKIEELPEEKELMGGVDVGPKEGDLFEEKAPEEKKEGLELKGQGEREEIFKETLLTSAGLEPPTPQEDKEDLARQTADARNRARIESGVLTEGEHQFIEGTKEPRELRPFMYLGGPELVEETSKQQLEDANYIANFDWFAEQDEYTLGKKSTFYLNNKIQEKLRFSGKMYFPNKMRNKKKMSKELKNKLQVNLTPEVQQSQDPIRETYEQRCKVVYRKPNKHPKSLTTQLYPEHLTQTYVLPKNYSKNNRLLFSNRVNGRYT